jgi:metallo-beta-lactamase family protein
VVVEFHDAGHTLGSGAVKVTETSTGKVLVFSGDVGRPNAPLLHDPDPFLKADAFISECTYGGKVHGPMSAVAEQLAEVINRTVNRGGILMVPAFALGRSQIMIEEIHILFDQKKIPGSLPVFVDSPLATRLTQVHRDFDFLLDDETRRMVEPFDYPNLHYVANPTESMALNSRKDPFIVIAGSGMCESGRILHHLKHHVRDPRCTVLLPGYQAQNTLGRRIQDREPFVNILGDRIPLNCEVDTLEGLSAHADGAELLEYTAPLTPTKIFLVHGEVPQAEAHQTALRSHGFPDVTIASRGDVVTV